jgi:hypothetical protein
VAITHAYASTKADPADATVIGKTKWNAAHTDLVNVYMVANTNFAHKFRTPIKLSANTALCCTPTGTRQSWPPKWP